MRSCVLFFLLAIAVFVVGSQRPVVAQDLKAIVSTEEMKSYLSSKYLDKWAEKIDGNDDGKVSKWEFRLAEKALMRLLEEEKVADEKSAEAKKKIAELSSVERMNASFNGRDPLLGTKVEDLIAFDESGGEFAFEDLRGKHVVVVFGCLT
jgi:hypothetical protein